MRKEIYIDFFMLLITFEIKEKPALLVFGRGGLYTAETWVVVGIFSLKLFWWHKPAIRPNNHWAFVNYPRLKS